VDIAHREKTKALPNALAVKGRKREEMLKKKKAIGPVIPKGVGCGGLVPG